MHCIKSEKSNSVIVKANKSTCRQYILYTSSSIIKVEILITVKSFAFLTRFFSVFLFAYTGKINEN